MDSLTCDFWLSYIRPFHLQEAYSTLLFPHVVIEQGYFFAVVFLGGNCLGLVGGFLPLLTGRFTGIRQQCGCESAMH